MRGADTIVLIHGIWMNGLGMHIMERRLRHLGHRTLAPSYAFLRRSPAENADRIARDIVSLEPRRLHFVGFSLGGIVAMHLLQRHPELSVSSVVLIGSPVRGSHVAHRLNAHRVARPLLGKSVQLGLLGGAPVWGGRPPLGVINGCGSGLLLRVFLPPDAEGDGVVMHHETLAEVATDVAVVPSSHLPLVWSRECVRRVDQFVRGGAFQPFVDGGSHDPTDR